MLEWLAQLWRNLRLMDAVMVTSLPLLSVALLVGDGVVRASKYAQFDDWWTAGASVDQFVRDRATAIATLPSRVTLRQQFAPDAADAGILRIDVPQRRWDAMRGDAQAMWDEWVDATVAYGGTSLDARLRKRGDNSIHWLTDKGSFTVRTSRDEFYKTYRQFALSTKDVLPSYLANRLAHEFDLLVPDTEVVPVYLNNQFYGMFRFLEVVDESFLRRLGRMPGNIFRGDTAERSEVYKSAPRDLFVNPYIWDRVAENDRWTAAGPDQLRLMLEDLNGGTFEDHERLMARFDLEEYARLFAYFMLVGDPYHSSGVNNQFLYEDPSTQLLHPIPWDIRLRDLAVRERGLNGLFRELLRDPWLTDRIMHEVARSLFDQRVDAVAERLVLDAQTRYKGYFDYDRLRTGLVPDVGTAEGAVALIQANVRTLRQWLTDDTVAVGLGHAGPLQILDFETRGLVGVDLLALDGSAQNGQLRLYLDRNRNGVLDSDDPVVPARVEGRSLVLDQPVPLLATWNTADGGFDPGRMPFRLFVTGATGDTLWPRLANRITGEPAATTELTPGQVMAVPTGWHAWQRREEPRGVIRRFAGEVHLSETVRIPPGDTVVVSPGTTFRLDPDVSFVSKGVVRFEGTANRPIRMMPAVPGRPWGAFSLLGSGSDGSVIRHVEFVEGGGALVDRVEYSGMVNVHWARGVVLDSVAFLRNRRSDDTFHAVHADITLRNSRFVDANSDAIDLDMSTGEISGNLFDGSGGDAIDLMTSTPRIIGNRIRNAGDKGISVGEASAPIIFANVIEDSSVGIEIKDRSAPIILNNEIRGSGVGLGSHAKNWRYGGSGFGFIANTRFESNAKPLDADLISRLTAVGVEGLDVASAESSGQAALTWLYRALGLEVDELRVGLPDEWRTMSPMPPVEEFRFVDGFESVADGWTAGPHVTRFEKRHGVLVVEVEGAAGVISRDVGWDLGSAAGGVLVLELAGRDLQQVRIEAEGDGGRVADEVTIPADPTRFSVVEVLLPAGHYRRVTLTIEPTPGLSHIQRTTGLSVIRAGRLSLRSLAVYPAAGQDPGVGGSG